ncbi:MAG: ABC transporter substrate-binding protein [Clostridia bacterium]|nr:ABC transporter substrate-binding protein [Clostridia bacterium]
MRKWIVLVLLLLAPSLAAAQAPERVISLYGSFSEAWVQAGGTLVGVTDDAIQERGLDLPDAQIIGTTKAPNLECIIALEPDWVILSADIAQQVSAMQVLQDAGIACTAFRVDTWQDYAAMMDVFTQQTGRRDLYEQIVVPMERSIRQTVEKAASQEGPTVLLLRAYSGGAKAKGTDNLAGVMLQDLGCVNLVDLHPSLLEELSLEAIVTEDPDWILVSIMGGDEQAALAALEETLGANPAFRSLRAVQEGRMQVLPKELFHYKPNARWAESYEYLYEMLFQK